MVEKHCLVLAFTGEEGPDFGLCPPEGAGGAVGRQDTPLSCV